MICLLLAVFNNLNSSVSAIQSTMISQYPQMAEFLKCLAHSTIVSLADPKSNQTRAFQWLTAHPDLNSMEEWRKTQLFALATLYYSWDGPNWEGEHSYLDYHTDECFWYPHMMFCESPYFEQCEGGLQICALAVHRLAGSIPPEIGLLSRLHGFVMMETEMSGSIPSEIGRMTGLYELGLTIVDSIPTELGLLTGLTKLSLSVRKEEQKSFTASIPSEIGLLSELQQLILKDCNLEVAIRPRWVFYLR
jgi:hypothetical protein